MRKVQGEYSSEGSKDKNRNPFREGVVSGLHLSTVWSEEYTEAERKVRRLFNVVLLAVTLTVIVWIATISVYLGVLLFLSLMEDVGPNWVMGYMVGVFGMSCWLSVLTVLTGKKRMRKLGMK